MVCQLIQDHPRRCGENKEAQAIKVLCTGSPPQVRGKQKSQANIEVGHRITPAGAGKTRTALCRCLGTEDHPRRCGDNSDSADAVLRRPGSPPQVRGKREDRRNAQTVSGITPAGAGKTPRRRRRKQYHGDHPRRCGENNVPVRGFDKV